MPKVIEDYVRLHHEYTISSYCFDAYNERNKELLRKFPYEERDIIIYLIKRDGNFDAIYQNYLIVKEFIGKIITVFKPEVELIPFLKKNLPVTLLTKEQIFSRLALLSCGKIDEREALEKSYLLYFYTDEMIYLAIRALKERGEVVTPEGIREYLSDPNNELKRSASTPMRMKSVIATYKLNLEKKEPTMS